MAKYFSSTNFRPVRRNLNMLEQTCDEKDSAWSKKKLIKSCPLKVLESSAVAWHELATDLTPWSNVYFAVQSTGSWKYVINKVKLF